MCDFMGLKKLKTGASYLRKEKQKCPWLLTIVFCLEKPITVRVKVKHDHVNRIIRLSYTLFFIMAKLEISEFYQF